jgi:hypothetical protein
MDKQEILIDKMHTPNGTRHRTLANIIKWALTHCRDQNVPFPRSFTRIQQSEIDSTYKDLIQAQSKIGWNQLIRGRWATQWIQHMELDTPDAGGNN